MEEQADGWLTVLEKNGLGPAAGIRENYGIDSETDLLVLDQDDFSKLASRGLTLVCKETRALVWSCA